MRNILLIAALSCSALTPAPADACGGYMPEPAMFRVSSHVGRTFVLMPTDRAPDGLAWRRIMQTSFDATEIADGRDLAEPAVVTLVGPAGTRMVTSTKHVFLARSWDFDHAMGAIEVGERSPRDFAIAIEGKHEHATWIPVERRASTRSRVAWAKQHGADVTGDELYVARIPGTKLETLSYFSAEKGKFVTMLVAGGRSHGVWEGSVLGAVANQGVRKLVLVDKGRITQVYLGAA